MGSVYNILKRVRRGRGKQQQIWSAPYQHGQPMIQHPPLQGESPPPAPQPVQFIQPPVPVPVHKPVLPIVKAATQPLSADALSVPALPQVVMPSTTSEPAKTLATTAQPKVAATPPLPIVPLPTAIEPQLETEPQLATEIEPELADASEIETQIEIETEPETELQPLAAHMVEPTPPPPPPPTLADTTIRVTLNELPVLPDAEPIIDATGEPIIIPAPHLSVGHYIPQIVVHHDRGSIITEQYRAIRLQILARCRNRKLQTHVITSSAPDEGKTLTAINLAMAFAELQNKRTLLIEGDLRRPSFQQALGQSMSPGLLQLLREDIDQAIHDTPYDNVKFMPAGDHGTTSSTELLSTHRFPQILDQLKQQYDHIFIDTPPVISVTDACIFGALADEVILVVRLNETPVEVVDRTKRLLRASNCEVAGVVLTHMKYHIPKALYRYL